jgi:DNA-binding response OmpR family regulator
MPRKETILVVDADHDAAEALVALLESHGYEALAAQTCADALEAARGHRCSFVFLEQNVRGSLDGWGLVPSLRSLAEPQAIGIIAVSDTGTAQERSRAFAAGCDAFLRKPLHLETIVSMLLAVAATL